jgi:CRP/FNR family cyclic AMP-dependent transcriptional regulator
MRCAGTHEPLESSVLQAQTFSIADRRDRTRRAPLLELDPELGARMSAQRLASAHAALRVPVLTARRGAPLPDPGDAGLLVLSGALAREVGLEDTISTELLGPGDVIMPPAPGGSHGLLELELRCQVLADARVARLDLPAVAYPEIACALLQRVARQTERLATVKAISQLNSVERRLLALFRDLADRWGRVTTRGLLVPLTLSHRLLGELIGARRPTVSVALGALARTGTLSRLDDGTWLLAVDAPPGRVDGSQRSIPHRRRLIAAPDQDELASLREENARLRALIARAVRDRVHD